MSVPWVTKATLSSPVGSPAQAPRIVARIVALIVTAGARFLIPFFATDQGKSRFQTLHGILHMILAVIPWIMLGSVPSSS
jgi:hypothetical protein